MTSKLIEGNYMDKVNILAIGAHPDDIEFGCGGTLIKYTQKGHRLFLLVMTQGGLGATTATRMAEQMDSKEIMGAEEIYWGGYEDTHLIVDKELVGKIEDVIKGISEKLIHRHPHIFGLVKVENAEEVTHNWEVLKREERGEDISILSGVPEEMPALSYSQSIQRRVARVGFDWEDVDGVIDKLAEEVTEFKNSTEEEKAEEFGDLLFTLVNIARRMGIDSEAALREANREGDAIICSQGADPSIYAEIRNPESSYRGSVAYFPEKYAFYCISIALDVLEGNPVPNEVFVPHVVIDVTNINDYYPE